MAHFESNPEKWFTRNLGYEKAIRDLRTKAEYFDNPGQYFAVKAEKLAANAQEVGEKFKAVYEKFTGLGYPDDEAIRIATNIAKSESVIDQLELDSELPASLYRDAAARNAGTMLSTYGQAAVNVLSGQSPLHPRRKRKSHRKKSHKKSK